MNIEAFLLCDAATDSFGKLNVLGAFDTIRAKEFPVAHSQCSVALRLRMSRIETGSHKLTIHIVDEDGNFIVPPLDGNFNVGVGSPDQTTPVNIILNLQSLKIEHAGEYAINLAIDGRQEASLPLYVKEIA